MPYKSARPCSTAGCPRLVREPGVSRCPEHQQEYARQADARRKSPAERGYGAEWKVIRDRFIRYNSTCVRCGKPSIIAHHKIPRNHGGTDDYSNLLALCSSCHSQYHAKSGDYWDNGAKSVKMAGK